MHIELLCYLLLGQPFALAIGFQQFAETGRSRLQCFHTGPWELQRQMLQKMQKESVILPLFSAKQSLVMK